ncbi:Holliday junction ATP-dependent DNA helicase RuvA [Thiosulfatimonas sediminis]|uniref:Holliday junction branch migration complex subunit RuvA n=1 Tax=Thiosulfatimonas sediminis TaxID=2675054 RepID=A0A6F8PUL2_9GAMM|nr:Holliday junction branch migration protein RuvA [Thiosulfatimonas sediminis]BBP45717.1 Holliday junction ATP-dependent DNA helicase RuvA [Thiosulfatimonas sediminis]
MIGFLKGFLAKKQPPILWLDVQGVGYELEAPMSTFYQLNQAADEEVLLLTHLHVREDAMQLFGFATEAERILFKTLIKVNGIGAKMALAVLSSMTVSEFCQSVEQSDVTALTRIPGVGKKTAERLQIEIRDRLKPLIESGLLNYRTDDFALQSCGALGSVSGEALAKQLHSDVMVSNKAVEALLSLGYKVTQAEKMVKQAYQQGMTLEALIKAALQGVKLA